MSLNTILKVTKKKNKTKKMKLEKKIIRLIMTQLIKEKKLC